MNNKIKKLVFTVSTNSYILSVIRSVLMGGALAGLLNAATADANFLGKTISVSQKVGVKPMIMMARATKSLESKYFGVYSKLTSQAEPLDSIVSDDNSDDEFEIDDVPDWQLVGWASIEQGNYLTCGPT